MKKRSVKNAFTLVELLIVISIVAILSVVAYIGTQRAQVGSLNNRVTADLLLISEALETYKQSNEGLYPIPQIGQASHVRCFNGDTSYAHDCDQADFIQSVVDGNLISQRYLQELPTDPRTNARYAYSVTSDGQYFQVAGLLQDQDGIFSSRVEGNLAEGYRLPGIIQSWSGPGFVMDGSELLPYSPDQLEISGRLSNPSGVSITAEDGQNKEVTDTIYTGDTVTVTAGGSVTLHLSDGSIVTLGDPAEATQLQILPQSIVEKNDESGILTKIYLQLTSGKIWTKAARLSQGSEFNIMTNTETTEAIAGVRGTEFGIDASNQEFDLPVLILFSGSVWVGQNEEIFTIEVEEGNSPIQAFMSEDGPQDQEELADLPEWASDLRQAGTGLSEGVIPYLIGSIAHVERDYEIMLSFNDITTDGNIALDGLEIFGESQTQSPRVLEKDAEPMIDIDDSEIDYDEERQVFIFPLNYEDNENSYLWRIETQDHEPIILRVYLEDDDGNRTYSALSWPPRSFLEQLPEGEETQEDLFVLDSQIHPELAFALPDGSPTVSSSPIGSDGSTNEDDLNLEDYFPEVPELDFSQNCELIGGIFDEFEESCWILADLENNCEDSCNDSGLTCLDESNGSINWNDDLSGNDKCIALTGGSSSGEAGPLMAFGPYYFQEANLCYARNASLGSGDFDDVATIEIESLCSTMKGYNGAPGNNQRICSCK